MKMFDLKGAVLGVASPNIVSLLSSIEMYRGKTLSVTKAKKVDKLEAIARKSAILASCNLGNVFLSDQQEKDLLEKGKPASSFPEFMVSGYSKAIDLIDQVNKYQPFDRSFICTLHYYMYKDYNPELGGIFKDTQNYIQEIMADGSYRTIFVPAAPEEASVLLDNLIYQFNMCAQDEEVNKLLLIACFMLDFMCIHPFQHGNGRLSRLILTFLLKKYGYDIDMYYSIAYLIKQQVGTYIDSFEASADKWYDNENDYTTYVTFVLKMILEAYRKLDYILEISEISGTADEKILRIILDSATPISKSVVQNVLYAASSATIEKGLAKLQKEGRIQLITKGRYSKYFRV